jgi:biopolymer transport protein ExbD
MAGWREEEEGFEIPMTPLIDVVFLLLIFFLVATNFTRKELDHKLKLPQALGGEKSEVLPEILVINIRQDGTLVIDGKIREAEKLGGIISDWRAKHPDKNVAIRGDGQVPYQKIMQVMGLCKSLGVDNIDLPVEEPGSASP